MATATKEKPKAKAKASEESATIQRFKEVFETIDEFFGSMTSLDAEIVEARAEWEAAKSAADAAKDRMRDLEAMRQSSERSLMRFLKPQAGEILPLFDQMEPADEEIHGENAGEWRKEPVAALRISAKSLDLLTGADIVLVGQLQDRILEAPGDWWTKIDGMSQGMAAAIQDGLNEFIFKRTQA